MGTEGQNAEGFITPPESLSPEQRRLTLPLLDEAALIDKFQNVGLRPQYGGGAGGSFSSSATFPIRAHAEDCAFYLKTGTCKFGPQCKFNHPWRDASVVRDRSWKGQVQPMKHVQCKYFMSPAGCKYGTLCKYGHSTLARPMLNFVGLPLREGVRECPYYMRTGSCSFGANCAHHHPEPLSSGIHTSMRRAFTPRDGCDSGPLRLPENAPTQPAAPWIPNPVSPGPLPFQDSKPHHSVAGGHWRPEPNPYQAPRMPPPAYPGPQPHVYGPVNEYPQRPGQPECAYFMKTGNCKFKLSCRFHHPKIHYEFLLNEKGLPIRPGRNICQHYQSFGVCKFGRACLFDHPVNLKPSNVDSWSSSTPVSGSWK